MMSFRRPLRWPLLAGLVVALFGLAAPASAQYNTPESSNRFTTTIYVQSDSERFNSQDSVTGYMGVEDCRQLKEDNDFVTFLWELAPSQNRSYSQIEFNQVRLAEFPQGASGPSDCTFDNPTGCAELAIPSDQDPTTADIQFGDGTWVPGDVFSGTRLASGVNIEVNVRFDTLLSYEDGEDEACAFVNSDQTGSTPDAGTTNDAGMTNDAGTTTDAMGADTALGDAGGDNDDQQTVSGENRFYVARLFLIGERSSVTGTNADQELIDAPLLFDRTRPPSPANVRAAATQNVLKVRFAPPSEEEAEGYTVFYSNEPFPQNTPPEQLAEDEAIGQKTLSSTSETDNGELTGEVTGIDQEVGEQLHVAVVAEDRADNFSQPRQAQSTVDIQQSIDWWELYKEAGGQEPGGCACRQTEGMPVGFLLALVSFGGLVVVRRRW